MTDDYPIPDMDDTEDELRAEIARLRATLEKIVHNGDQGIHVPGPYDIAKEALANGSTGFIWCEVVHVSDTEGTRGHGFMALVPNSALAKEGK